MLDRHHYYKPVTHTRLLNRNIPLELDLLCSLYMSLLGLDRSFTPRDPTNLPAQ